MAAFRNALARVLLGKDYLQGSPYYDRGNSWFPIVHEPYTGAWQRNVALRTENILSYHAVYACIERIASDVAKCRLRLVEENDIGIWEEIVVPAFSPVLRKPNRYQTRIQFFEAWMLSKLMAGNTYALKERDARGVVIGLYVLDPQRIQVLVAPDGSVLYELSPDNLSGLVDTVKVPASEIIHDMMTLKHHHLCGLSPMAPAALAAVHGIQIQRTSTDFFANAARPSGAVTVPGPIKKEEMTRLKEEYQEAFRGLNSGKLAILVNGVKFEKMTMDFVDAQLIEQLGISAKMVCSSFGVPPHMVQVGDPPNYNNIETLNQSYYSQTLQKHFEAIELLLDEGLGLTEVSGKNYGTWFDLDDLLRMEDSKLIEAEAKAVGAGIKAPDESRARLNLGPVPGGKSPYLQQQNYSLAALAKRDAQADPFAPNTPPKPEPPPPPPAPPAPAAAKGGDDDDQATAAISHWATRELRQFLATG